MIIVFDLDDTLYDEVDFVKSGFREVANFLGNEKFFDFMWNDFIKNGSGKIFDRLIKAYNLKVDIDKLIEIYRFHYPDIAIDVKTENILKYLQSKYKLGLITDGHYVTQRNKFKALGLNKYIHFPLFTDCLGAKKPAKAPFLYFMEMIKSKTYVYVADNPKKDFIAPKELGWRTIRFKNPKGIYKDIPNDAEFEITDKKDLINLLETLI